jgi:murein DD-endopeptidase MepM/ murein hydrolase activator NlpD
LADTRRGDNGYAVPYRFLLALGAAALAAIAGSAGAAGPAGEPQASGKAWAVRVLVAGSARALTPTAAAPPAGAPATTGGFSWPADGSVISTGATSATSSSSTGSPIAAEAGSEVASIIIFGGDITVDSLSARASAIADESKADGSFDGTQVVNLQALGQTATSGRLALDNWGYVTIGASSVDDSAPAGTVGYQGTVTALDVYLTADHGGLPAGSEIILGYAQAGVQTAPPPPPPAPTVEPAPGPNAAPGPKAAPEPNVAPGPKTAPEPIAPPPEPKVAPAPPAAAPAASSKGPSPGDRPQLRPQQTEPVVGVPQTVHPPLEAGPYVFPIYGESAFGDSYGEFRSDVSYHHGDDIFGQLGQPLLAVADGTVFSVGWNRIGGNRLWLRDAQGNEFYYAHLAAFSTNAFDGAKIVAGDVVGFMGNTGDAEGAPTHLHFEIHPVSLLFLGYDGAVDPTSYLQEWKHVTELPFGAAAGWAPSAPGTLPAPEPGAYLLGVSDISAGDGLNPSSLRLALARPLAPPSQPGG